MLYDMHCHIAFAQEHESFIRDAERLGIGALSSCVTPSEYDVSRSIIAGSLIYTGLGMHPWWIADGRCEREQLDQFISYAPSASFIGEIGLDFSHGRDEDGIKAKQIEYFTSILDSIKTTPKVLSLHTVKAAQTVLDLLEKHDELSQHTPIFHWFSGSSDELQRAISYGCYFSVGPMMLRSKRGRAYAQAIPLSRLLLETDDPAYEGAPWNAEEWKASLEATIGAIAQLRRIDEKTLAKRIERTSESIMMTISAGQSF